MGPMFSPRKLSVRLLTGARDGQAETAGCLQHQHAKVRQHRVRAAPAGHPVQAHVEEDHRGEARVHALVRSPARGKSHVSVRGGVEQNQSHFSV